MMEPRHQRLINAIVVFRANNGYSPTIREIIDMAEYTSTSMVGSALRQLREDGLIDYVDFKSRTITLEWLLLSNDGREKYEDDKENIEEDIP